MIFRKVLLDRGFVRITGREPVILLIYEENGNLPRQVRDYEMVFFRRSAQRESFHQTTKIWNGIYTVLVEGQKLSIPVCSRVATVIQGK